MNENEKYKNVSEIETINYNGLEKEEIEQSYLSLKGHARIGLSNNFGGY